MDGIRRSLSVRPADLAGVAREASPRIFYVGCDRSNCDAAPVRPYGARCLKNDDWSVGFSAVAGTARGRAVGSIWADLFARLIAKTEYVRYLVRQIPRFDIVHVYGGTARDIERLALPALVLARFFGKRAVLHLTSADTEHFLDSRGGWFHPLLKAADAIVVGSRYLQKTVSRSHLAAEILTCPVDFEGIEHRPRRNLQPRILMDCDLEPEQNVASALKAFRIVKQKYPRAEITIVGDGSQFEALHRLAAGFNVHGVSFAGRIAPSALGEIYNDHDLFLASSSQDESPASLARAFAAGLPVVTTDADGLLHMVRDRVSALVVPINDHAALADRVIELVEDNALTEKLSLEGKKEARRYAWTRVRQDWVNLYMNLASRNYS